MSARAACVSKKEKTPDKDVCTVCAKQRAQGVVDAISSSEEDVLRGRARERGAAEANRHATSDIILSIIVHSRMI